MPKIPSKIGSFVKNVIRLPLFFTLKLLDNSVLYDSLLTVLSVVLLICYSRLVLMRITKITSRIGVS